MIGIESKRLSYQVFEIVFPDRARSSVRLRMEFLKIHDMKVADYHLVHKLKEKGCTKLHTGTLKLVRYIDLMRLNSIFIEALN